MGRKVTIAIEGCGHGELDKIYATLQLLEQREGKKIDLLICCGDFQAVRNLDDLETMACPPKYRSMQTFYKYYSGERVAPFPTLFIGGNHEAANHLWELYYGGWAAPNIYFMGYAGAVRFGGLRIAGLSGIYKSHDYTRGHHEALPYTDSTIRSMYHVRDFEVYRLLQLLTPTDIFLSHDWPTNIARYGNTAQLLSRKSFLRSEVEDGSLGSPPAAQLLQALRPAYWFSAHLHTKFAALVQHPPAPAAAGAAAAAGGGAGAERQSGGAEGAEGAAGPGPGSAAAAAGAGGAGPGAGPPGAGGFPTTRFLALDKCLPGRDFLQVLELEAPADWHDDGSPLQLCYDPEWLAVLRGTHHLTNLRFRHQALPGMGQLRSGPRPADLEYVQQALAARGGATIPHNFTVTAPPYDPAAGQRKGRMPQRHERNPQTVALMELLGLPYNLDHSELHGGPGGPPPGAGGGERGREGGGGARNIGRIDFGGTASRAPLTLAPRVPAVAAPNPEEIDLDLDDDDEEDAGAAAAAGTGGEAGAGAGGAAGEDDDAPPSDGEGEGGPSGAAAAAADDPMFKPIDL
ncbi:hypothetical protein CHLRE_02g146950v5 [Chlamydomonas reinhardtii]|uniref:Lariat debranching enzyme C-terminal domain-containing protein n=1 Tax=Chlamydomonas reinhardtii TaxID=3055 RepID=A0A2K3E3P4_CHLRE|nr:uncharacterized protein CHLRE_02g146950v5 [Chlamydomonas reinhardtii]PNW87402.1 hypothetical protein CHLRE_02g146950v5 [Chlamydomonas reinhardtii]